MRKQKLHHHSVVTSEGSCIARALNADQSSDPALDSDSASDNVMDCSRTADVVIPIRRQQFFFRNDVFSKDRAARSVQRAQ